MNEVLMVAEKPILALSIANILSDGTLKTRKGSNGACNISGMFVIVSRHVYYYILLEYSGIFMGKPARFKVTSTWLVPLINYNNAKVYNISNLLTCQFQNLLIYMQKKSEFSIHNFVFTCSRMSYDTCFDNMYV